jgi:hypothetical protein
MTLKSALTKKAHNLNLFHLSESDHQSETTVMSETTMMSETTVMSETTMMSETTVMSETTMMTHQMCLLDRGKIAGIYFFLGYSPSYAFQWCDCCLHQRLSNLNKRLEVMYCALRILHSALMWITLLLSHLSSLRLMDCGCCGLLCIGTQ